MSSRRRRDIALNTRLDILQEGEHYREDLKPATKERMLFKTDGSEEKNVQESKEFLQSLSLGYRTKRDINMNYSNPQEMLPKFGKYVDEIPAFDEGALSIIYPYDNLARKQANLVISGRAWHAIEDRKYDVTIENAKEKLQMALKGKEQGVGEKDAGITPEMAHMLARASLMETTQAL